ncbi:MAG: carotenoid oxygenase family protein [Leptospira sp.]|nr:carotenoid oxygenase family protein [Leptospira sp.]
MKDFRLGFQSQVNEWDKLSVKYSGHTLPEWLIGTLYRNGPALYDLGSQKMKHFFDGLSKIHSVEFTKDGIFSSGQFLKSKDYNSSTKEKKITYSEFASVPDRNIFEKIFVSLLPNTQFGDNASINFMKLKQHLVAIADVPVPVSINPNDIKTEGEFKYDDKLNLVINSPHPQIDHLNKVIWNFGIEIDLLGTHYVIFKIPDGTRTRIPIAKIHTEHAAYMHSFITTENYIILTEHPLVLDLLKMISMGITGSSLIEAFEWKENLGTKFIIVDKKTGKTIEKFSTDTFFTFHHMNAYESEGSIILDLPVYKDMEIINQFYLKRIFSEEGGNILPGELRRYKLDLQSNSSNYKIVSDCGLEMPIINSNFFGKKYSFGYGVSNSKLKSNDFNNQLVKVNMDSGKYDVWFEEGSYPTEPIFVANPNSILEEDGILLSLVLDGKNESSYVLILDAKSFKEIGRAELPYLIPFGFHGMYLSENNLH